MSGELAHDVYRRDVKPGIARDVLVVYCLHARPDGTNARPERTTVADQVGRSTSTVKRHIRRWREAGVLVPTAEPRRTDGGGGRYPTVYRVDLSPIPYKAGMGPQRDDPIPADGMGSHRDDPMPDGAWDHFQGGMGSLSGGHGVTTVRDVVQERPLERPLERTPLRGVAAREESEAEQCTEAKDLELAEGRWITWRCSRRANHAGLCWQHYRMSRGLAGSSTRSKRGRAWAMGR
jgi:hypothetical protein